MRDRNGTPYRIIGSLRDISEERYQEELRNLELRVYQSSISQDISFNQVVDELLQGIERLHPGMHCSVILADDEFRITPFSAPSLPEAYTNMLAGLQLGENDGSCGRSMHMRSPVVVSDINTDPLWEKYRFVSADFGLRSCWSVPLVHGNGKVMGSFAMYYYEEKIPTESEWHTVLRVHNLLRMLMENHQAVEQLRISNERYDIVAKATHDLVWDWNLETGELYRDPEGLKKVYGVSNNESIRHINQWLTHIHPEDVLHVQQVIYNILVAENESNFDVQYRFRREDGTYSHIYDRGMIMREDGKAKRMIGAAQDITDRKKLEEQLLKQEVNRQKVITQAIIDTQESERAEMGKELHDNVNQLLTTTKLYLELAKTNAELKDELISKSADNVLYIINEIRKISKTLMLPSLGDLGLIDSLHDLAENLNVTQKIRVDFTYDSFDEKIISDNQRLMLLRVTQEAVNNIVNHASATHACITLKQLENEIVLTVSDNGKGFDLNQSRKGIGLSNIHNRVSLFNGNLMINTEPGKGCNLIVSIPFTSPNNNYGQNQHPDRR